MGGGIIIQRSSVLLTAIMEKCFYESLSTNDQEAVEQISTKPPAERTAEDVQFLAAKLCELASED